MPRRPRITIDNAVYHIITRGNQKQKVFKEGQDYEKYLRLLNKYKKRHRFKLYCFCLMPNHVHLLMEISEAKLLNKIMRGLNLSYALYYNYKYKKVGHLWQDRFKSRIIQKDSYLLKCVQYIEGNPVRASLVSDINAYLWNSYLFRLKNSALLDDFSGDTFKGI